MPVPNWDWDEVEGEERLGETIWGDYRVVGTFDGETFTVTEVYGPRFPGGAPEDGIETPCPEPEGGWRAVDPTRASESDMQAAMRAARSEPDFSGFWIEYIDEVAAEDAAYANPDTDPELVEEGLGGGNIIVNVAFTGDLAVHERETRALWGGALCMVQHERTLDELEDIQRDLDGTVEDLDLVFLSSGIDETRNVVELEVAVLSEETMQELDARYGEGAVRASGVLQPVR